MAEEEEEAVVFFKNAYLLQLMYIGCITSDGGCFPLTVKRERLEIDVGSVAQEETTLEQVLPEVFPVKLPLSVVLTVTELISSAVMLSLTESFAMLIVSFPPLDPSLPHLPVAAFTSSPFSEVNVLPPFRFMTEVVFVI